MSKTLNLLQQLPRLLIGRRTLRELAHAAIPARLYLVLGALAVCAAVGMQVLAWMIQRTGPAWLATEALNLASIFRAMPLWFVIGGCMSQIAVRLNVAIDDARAYLTKRASQRRLA